LRRAIPFLFLSLALSIHASSSLMPYAAARPLLLSLSEVLPTELNTGTASQREAAWPGWLTQHDREIRERLERGDDDTIVNWLLFGTSFTRQPRVLLDGTGASGPEVVPGRIRDFLDALASPGTDERRVFARATLQRHGHGVDTPADRDRMTQYLQSEIARVGREQRQFAQELAAARTLQDATAEFATRSRLFRDRGLSLDTTIQPGFAVERALDRLRGDKLLAPRSVRRVAVIGPGLDFADKTTGYDFYPQQTVQPFALIDSLIRLGLDHPGGVQLTTLDVSPRINDHLARARKQAASGSPYLIRIPLDLALSWKPDVVEYWKRFGDRVGSETRDAKPAAAGRTVDVRTIRVRPQEVLRVTPEALNVVVARLEDAPFDLVLATNVFVYYDVLDQCLALTNVEAMLRPGGFLLSNNALLELPASHMRSAGYLTVQYSDREDDGDHIVWYRRLPD